MRAPDNQLLALATAAHLGVLLDVRDRTPKCHGYQQGCVCAGCQSIGKAINERGFTQAGKVRAPRETPQPWELAA